MSTWYLYSILALVLLGTQRFLYKVTAERGCNSALTTTVFMATVTLLSSAVYLVSGHTTTDYATLFTLALANSLAFAISTMANIEALRHIPASITFPLTRLSIVLVLVYSIIVFNEQLTPIQWLGMTLSFLVVVILGQDAKKGQQQTNSIKHNGFWFVGVCILCGAVASISSKLAAVATDKAGFIAISYLLGTIFSWLINKRWGGKQSTAHKKEALLLGISMGVLNFLGFYAFLVALSSGPLSAIALITGMHFVIAIGLSVLIYREQVSRRRGLGIMLMLLAVYLLKS